MLVKRSIVEKWYQRDSWVYQNFAYLFQNPLWTKKIPQGFSVCPYFWLNIFSFFIFRPFFVCPIQYLIRPLIKLFGRPAHAIDKGLYKFVKFTRLAGTYQKTPPALRNNLDEDYFSGVGTLMFLTLILAVSGIGAIATIVLRAICHFYPYISTTNLGTFSFWSIGSFMLLWSIIAIHKKITDTECKTMNYLWVWVTLFSIGIAIFIPNEFAQGFSIFFRSIGHLLSTLCSYAWEIICFFATWIWFGIKWAPIKSLLIPWWGYMLLASGIAWIGNKIISNPTPSTQQLKTETPEEFADRCKNAWLSILTRTLIAHPFWNKGDCFDWFNCDRFSFRSAYHRDAAIVYKETLYKKALELFFKNNIKTLSKTFPLLSQTEWSRIREISDTESRFYHLFETIKNENSIKDFPEISFCVHRFYDALVAAYKLPEMSQMIERYVKSEEALDAARKAKLDARKNSWSHKMCLQVTDTLNSVFCSIGKSIAWVGIQMWTFICYMGMLIKAKKQGACPYFTFTDPTTKK